MHVIDQDNRIRTWKLDSCTGNLKILFNPPYNCGMPLAWGWGGRWGARVLMGLPWVKWCCRLFSALLTVPMLLPWAFWGSASYSGSPPTQICLPPCHRRWLDTCGSASLEEAPRRGRQPRVGHVRFAKWNQGRLQRAVGLELVKSINKSVDGSSEGVIRVQLPLQAIHKVFQPPLRALCRRACN